MNEVEEFGSVVPAQDMSLNQNHIAALDKFLSSHCLATGIKLKLKESC